MFDNVKFSHVSLSTETFKAPEGNTAIRCEKVVTGISFLLVTEVPVVLVSADIIVPSEISQSSEDNVDLILLYGLTAGKMSLSHTVVELAMLFLTEIGNIS